MTPAKQAQMTPADEGIVAARAETAQAKALAAFVAKKAEIDEMLRRIQALSDDHFNVNPDTIHWGDVGTLDAWTDLLRRITNAAFHEGEFAA